MSELSCFLVEKGLLVIAVRTINFDDETSRAIEDEMALIYVWEATFWEVYKEWICDGLVIRGR